MLIKSLFKYWTYQVFAPGTVLRERYEAFKSLLKHDKRAHELIAELEEIYHDQIRLDFSVVEDKYARLFESVGGIVDSLGTMCPSRYLDLKDYFKKCDAYIRFMLPSPDTDASPPYTLDLSAIADDAAAAVGGKAVNLAAIGRLPNLSIPGGFVITTGAFNRFIAFNDLRGPIDARLAALDINDTAGLGRRSAEIRDRVRAAAVPPEIEAAVRGAFQSLAAAKPGDIRVAVRSSAVAEDSRTSFAGQYETVLNVRGDRLMEAYKQVVSSKYAPEALYYRISYGLTDVETPMAVLVQQMIDAEASGVMYTADLEKPETEQLHIHSVWGLGELLVSGRVSPDVFTVSKAPEPAIVSKTIGEKKRQMVFAETGSTRVVPVPETQRKAFSLDAAAVSALADCGLQLEAHFAGPQDVEWCRDGGGRLYILQSRPLGAGGDPAPPPACHIEEIHNTVLISGGDRASPGVGAGRVFVVRRSSDLDRIPADAVLVAQNASSRYVRVMGKLSAVVTDTGSTAAR